MEKAPTSKRAVVTGGNKGIGLEVTRQLAKLGFKVHCVARDQAGFEFSDDPAVHFEEYDLSDVQGIAELAHGLGEVDVLVNNAGIMNGSPFDGYPDDAKRRCMRVNLEAPVALMTHLAPALIRRGGRVVNVASIAGQIGHPDVWYGMSKAGLINATKSFARLLGPKGVTVHAVAPGPTETAMLATIPEGRRAAVKAATYAGRFATPSEIAQVIVWLATAAPSYVNGSCVDLNNGFFPR